MKMTAPLNDNWLFCDGFDPECLDASYDWTGSYIVSVPHCAAETDKNYFDEKAFERISTYTRSFFVPSSYTGSRIILRFGGVLSYAEVYVNGIFVTSHKGETAFEADITAPVVYDFDNRIVVKTDSTVRPDVPSGGYNGIFREVELRIETGETIKDAFVRTPDVSGASKPVEIDVELSDFYPDTVLEAEIIDSRGLTVGGLAPKTVLKRTMTLCGKIDEAAVWDTENPVLYTARVTLKKRDRKCDETSVSFGFRKAEFSRGGFFLNGKATKLIGLNRSDSFAYCGRAIPASAQREDARILKEELGLNVVRTHLSPSRAFIEECDRLGLLVIEDAFAEGGYIGADRWRDTFSDCVAEAVLRDRNSPSVIAWGVRVNDSFDCDGLYFKTHKTVKDLDPTRATIGSRNFMGSRMYEDVFGYNDYSARRTLSRPAKTGKLFVPYIITEHTGKIFPVKPFDGEAKQLELCFRHLRVMDKVLGSKKICGAIGTEFSDRNCPRNLGSGDNMSYYGVSDIFRMPKLAYAAYASQRSNKPYLKLSSSLAPDEFTGRLYAFTNCDCVKLMRGEKEIGVFYPDKKRFKNLPHPPVLISDFTGALDKEEGFTPFVAKLTKRFFKRLKQRGATNLSFSDKIIAKFLQIKLKTDLGGIIDMAEKYDLTPANASEFSVEGVIGGETAIRHRLGAGHGRKLRVVPQSDKIVCTQSYEVVKVELFAEDDDGEILDFDFSPVFLDREGAVDIVGPNSLTLSAGKGAFYVKSLIEGKGSVSVYSCGETEVLDMEVVYGQMERL